MKKKHTYLVVEILKCGTEPKERASFIDLRISVLSPSLSDGDLYYTLCLQVATNAIYTSRRQDMSRAKR